MPADVASAEAMAKGRLAKIAEGFIEAHGEMIGNPDVLPGAVLNLEKMGEKIDGLYRVGHAAHAFSKHGYFVKFDAVRIGKKKPLKPAKTKAQAAPSWVEIELKDSEGNPMAGERRVLDGTLDSEGKARVQGVKKGQCKVTFPDLPGDGWKQA
jgi:hypothetical protein